ncbi:hypothetical protein BD414DRAFT_478541 [Trametes punicea]|nr:hypothetical protein BD414DRAFT_478541 [Trametes punicea]
MGISWQLYCMKFPTERTREKNSITRPNPIAKNDHLRGRTCNLLIRSQTRCHYARRPLPVRCSYGYPGSGCNQVLLQSKDHAQA